MDHSLVGVAATKVRFCLQANCHSNCPFQVKLSPHQVQFLLCPEMAIHSSPPLIGAFLDTVRHIIKQ
jgi:hypothetical protein